MVVKKLETENLLIGNLGFRVSGWLLRKLEALNLLIGNLGFRF